MLQMPCEWANLWGSREGRVGSYRVSRVTTLGCTDGQFDTPIVTLVAPNGYKGFGPASTSLEDTEVGTSGGWNMIVAGIDVGKANLDVSVSEGPVNRFDNTVEGISKLLKHLAEQDANMAVCESTGGYERLVVDRLCKTGIHLHVAQPTRVRAFARACGYQAKTDQRDAQVLSRFGSVFQDHDAGITMPDPELEELRDLLRRRRQLVEQRVQELGRVDKVVSLAVAESTNRHIAWLEAEIENWTGSTRRRCRTAPSVPAGRTLPHCARCGRINRGHTGRPPAGIGTCGRQGPGFPGGCRSLVPGQRTKAGSAGHSRRPQRGSPRSVHLCLVSDPDGWRIAPLLSGTAPTWKAWEGCSGSGDAEVVAAAERRGPEGYTLGAGNCVKLSALHPCDGLDTKHGYCPVFRVHLSGQRDR